MLGAGGPSGAPGTCGPVRIHHLGAQMDDGAPQQPPRTLPSSRHLKIHS